jgi:MFS family permease
MEELLLTAEWVTWTFPRQLLREHAWHLRRAWRSMSPNAKALAGYNIFWTLPGAFSGIYLQVFMKEQGLTEIEIGSVVSAALTVQVVTALLSGFAAERFGRLRTVTWVDGTTWPLAYFLYAAAHGYIMFAGGGMLVGGVALLIPAWNSLFIQGSPRGRRMHIFAIAQIPWFIGAIVASASGFLVRAIGVTESCRWIFGAAVVSTAFGWWHRGKYLTDPDPRPKPIRVSFREAERFLTVHWVALQTVVRRRGLLIALLMQILFQAGLIIGGTYTNLYLVDERGVALPKATLAILPLIGGSVVLATTFLAVPYVSTGSLFRFLLTGLSLMGVNVLLLLLAAPLFGLPAVLAGSFIGSIGFAIFNPSVNANWADQMNDRERARLDAFRWVVTTLVMIPVPVFAGALYKEVHPRMPLLLIAACYALIAACAVWAVRVSRASSRT